MAKRPLRIGLSACFFHADPQRPIFKGKTLQYLEQSIAHWVMAQGAHVFMIPNPPSGGKVKLKDLCSEFDGLVLQGGSDVSPKSYGEEALRPEWAGDYIRDQYELALVKEFRRTKKPILGICRGLQLINVAFGGTLYQDIASQVPGSLNHREWLIYDQNFHEVSLVERGGLAKLAKKKTVKVNTVHHQAIKDLGKGLMVEAVTHPDEIIEAVRATSGSYVFAVQWHPEFHDPKDKSLFDGNIFLKEFLNEAKK